MKKKRLINRGIAIWMAVSILLASISADGFASEISGGSPVPTPIQNTGAPDMDDPHGDEESSVTPSLSATPTQLDDHSETTVSPTGESNEEVSNEEVSEDEIDVSVPAATGSVNISETPSVTESPSHSYDDSIKLSFYTMDENESYSVTDTVYVAYGDSIESFPDPNTPEGYTFVLWDDAEGNEITSETVFTKDVSIWAEYYLNSTYMEPLSEEEQVARSYSSVRNMTEDEIFDLYYCGETPKVILSYIQGINDYYGYDCGEWWLSNFLRGTVFQYILVEDIEWLKDNNLTLSDVYNALYMDDPDGLLDQYEYMQMLKEYKDTEAGNNGISLFSLDDTPSALSDDTEYSVSASMITSGYKNESSGKIYGSGPQGNGYHGDIYRLTLVGGPENYDAFCARYGYGITSGMSYSETSYSSLGISTSQAQTIYKIYRWYNNSQNARSKDRYLVAQFGIWLVLAGNWPTSGDSGEAANYMMHGGFPVGQMSNPNIAQSYLRNMITYVWRQPNPSMSDLNKYLHFYSNGSAANQWLVSWHYKIDPTPQPEEPTPDDLPEETGGAEPAVYYYGRIQIKKIDSETRNVILHETEFTIYEYDKGLGDYVESDYGMIFDGSTYYVSDYMLVTDDNLGKFYVTETERPYDGINSGYIPDYSKYYFKFTVDGAAKTVVLEGDTDEDTRSENYVLSDSGTGIWYGMTTEHHFPLATVYNTRNQNDPTFVNVASTGRITLTKGDLESTTTDTQGKTKTLDGASYTMYAGEDIWLPDGTAIVYYEGDEVASAVIQNGKLVFDNLYLGIYYIEENIHHVTADGKKMSYVPGYMVDENQYWLYLFYNYDDPEPVVEDSADSYDQVVKGKFSFDKESVDAESTDFLSGSGFTIYQICDLSKYNASWLNDDGSYNIDNIRHSYLNTNASKNAEGYYTDLYDFTGENAAVPILYARNVATTALQYPGITEYYYNQAQADLAAGRIVSLGGYKYRVAELFSNSLGIVESPYIPYGDYLIVETTVPGNHNQTEPFILSLYNGNTIISTGITDSIRMGYSITDHYDLMAENVTATEPYSTWYRGCAGSTIPDNALTQILKIYKFDSDTLKNVLAPGAVFALYKREALFLNNGTKVTSASAFATYKAQKGSSNFYTSNGITYYKEANSTGTYITYEIRIKDGVYYRYKRVVSKNDELVDYDTYTTKVTTDGEDCFVTVPKDLPVGQYVLEELQAPVGYWNDEVYYLVFMVTTDREYEFIDFGEDNEQKYLITEHYCDDETRGTLTIYKRGDVLTGITENEVENQNVLDALQVDEADSISFDYEEVYLGGAEYTVYAAEDIYTPDYQYEKDADGNYLLDDDGQKIRTTWFKEGDAVAVIRTGDLNQNTSEYVIYDGTDAQVVTYYDSTGRVNGVTYYGESSGTYRYYPDDDRHPIVKVTVNAEGKVTIELPLGTYEVRETKAPTGFLLSDDSYFVTYEWDNQWEQYVYNTHATQRCDDVKYDKTRSGETGKYSEEGLVWTNERMNPVPVIEKRAEETGTLLSGMVFGLYTVDPVYDYRGNLLINASVDNPVFLDYGITDLGGQASFDIGLPVGCYVKDLNGKYIRTDTETYSIGSSTYTVLGNLQEFAGYHVLAGYQEDTVTLSYEELTGEELGDDEDYPDSIYYLWLEFTGDGNGNYTAQVDVPQTNSGNYLVRELYTEYGIYLDDTEYGVSFQAYYDTHFNWIESYFSDEQQPEMTADMTDTATVLNKTSEVYVDKLDGKVGSELSGATLAITDNTNGQQVDKWVSNGAAHEIRALRLNDELPLLKNGAGTYTLSEISAPSGYGISEPVYFTLIRTPVYDENGDPVYDEDGEPVYEEYKNDVYYWNETYIKGIESSIVAYGDEDQYSWKVNEEGILALYLHEDVDSYEFTERLTHTEIINGEEIEVEELDPWNAVLYDEDTGTFDLEIAGIYIGDADITWPEGYFGNLDICDEFHETKVVNILASAGWVKAERNTVAMYDTRVVPLPSVPEEPEEPNNPPADSYNPSQYVYPVTVRISKQLLTRANEFNGAKVEVRDENGKVVDTFVTSDRYHYIKNLERGKTYTIHEVSAPNGYALCEDISFITSGKTDFQQVTIYDIYTRASINKVSSVDGAMLSGASLQIIDESGNVVDEWISNGAEHYMTQILKPGETYSLVEIKAPNGYRIADPVEFTMSFYNQTAYVSMVDVPGAVTGDGTMIMPYVIGFTLLLITVIAIVIVLIRKKRKNSQ